MVISCVELACCCTVKVDDSLVNFLVKYLSRVAFAIYSPVGWSTPRSGAQLATY